MLTADWFPAHTVPAWPGLYETQFDTGLTAVTMYSVYGWIADARSGKIVEWRYLLPDLEKAHAYQYTDRYRIH